MMARRVVSQLRLGRRGTGARERGVEEPCRKIVRTFPGLVEGLSCPPRSLSVNVVRVDELVYGRDARGLSENSNFSPQSSSEFP